MASAPLRQSASGTADASGCTIKFQPVPLTRQWTGSILVANSPLTTTWTLTVGGFSWGTMTGPGPFNIQALANEVVELVTASGVTSGTVYTASFIGSDDPRGSPYIFPISASGATANSPLASGGGPSPLIAPDFGYAGWTMEPLLGGTSDFGLTNQAPFGTIFKAEKTTTITKVGFVIGAATGVSIANGSAVAIYSCNVSTGNFGTINQLATTAAGAVNSAFEGAAWTTQVVDLSSGLAVTEGDVYYLVFLAVASTGGGVPQLVGIYTGAGSNTTVALNYPMSGAAWTTANQTYTSLPASFTAADLTPGVYAQMAWLY